MPDTEYALQKPFHKLNCPLLISFDITFNIFSIIEYYYFCCVHVLIFNLRVFPRVQQRGGRIMSYVQFRNQNRLRRFMHKIIQVPCFFGYSQIILNTIPLPSKHNIYTFYKRIDDGTKTCLGAHICQRQFYSEIL